MPAKKLSSDARAHMQKLASKQPSVRFWPTLEDIAAYQDLLGSALLWETSLREPARIDRFLGFSISLYKSISRHYLYQNCLYHIIGTFTDEEERLLVRDAFDSERRKFERLQKKFEAAEAADGTPRRPAISEEVRIAVWRRDSGKCARCGSRERLEYDHIIPISRGGSNTSRNIELLCETCNRQKSDRIQ